MTKTLAQELRECPFCGGEARTIGNYALWYVACREANCFAAIGELWDRDGAPEHHFHSEEDAVAAWNKRTALESQPDRGAIVDLTTADMTQDLRVLKAFLENEASEHVSFVNSMQARRTAEYKAKGDADANYRGLSGIEETKYWPFIQIVVRAIANPKGGE